MIRIIFLFAIISFSLTVKAEVQNPSEQTKSSLQKASVIGSETPKTYFLVSEKKSKYIIVLDPLASESEKWAAGELQYWIKEISGANLPIRNINESSNNPMIGVYKGYC